MAEQLNQMAMQLRYFEEQAQTLEQNIQLLQATIGNMEATLMTLSNLKEAKPNQEIMIKVGNSSYIKAKISEPDKVVIGVGLGFGTDVYVEKPIEAARETINGRIDEVKKAQNMVRENLEQIMQQIEKIRPEFERRYAQFQQGLSQGR